MTPAHAAVTQPDFLQRGNGTRDIRALLRFLDGLRPFFHSFFDADALALENGERVFVQVSDGKHEPRFRALINAGNVRAGFCFSKSASIPQNAVCVKECSRSWRQVFQGRR